MPTETAGGANAGGATAAGNIIGGAPGVEEPPGRRVPATGLAIELGGVAGASTPAKRYAPRGVPGGVMTLITDNAECGCGATGAGTATETAACGVDTGTTGVGHLGAH